MLSKSELVTMMLFKTQTKANYICSKISMSPQSFSQKLKRGTFSDTEMEQIAKAIGAEYHQTITLKDGEVIG